VDLGILSAMNISVTQNTPAIGEVRSANTVAALKSAVQQQASVLQLFDPAKSVPSPKEADKDSDSPPPPPKDSGRGRAVDRQA
jgi:hypothetical protein